MGLFEFLKDVGNDMLNFFGNEAEEIEKLLNTELAGKITSLKVEFDDGVATLTGNCDSQATREKAILLAGNLKGVEKVNADDLEAPPEEKKEETEFYTVQRGDSLSLIAKRYYGNAMKYPVIFEANREVIKDADLIYPGQRLRIPKNA